MRLLLKIIFLYFFTALAFSGCNKPEEAIKRPASFSANKKRPALVSAQIRDGKQALDFSLPGFSLVEGKEENLSLSDFRGKLVLLNFWATWCAPCVAEMPALERLYKTYQERDFVVVAIDVEPKNQREGVERFLKNNGITFPVLFDHDMELPEKFGITGFPETFFISPEGKVLAVLDPASKHQVVRFLSDRPWDSKQYLSLVGNLLEKQGK